MTTVKPNGPQRKHLRDGIELMHQHLIGQCSPDQRRKFVELCVETAIGDVCQALDCTEWIAEQAIIEEVEGVAQDLSCTAAEVLYALKARNRKTLQARLAVTDNILVE